MEALACGELGLDINYYYSLTPREFYNIAEGYNNKKLREFKDDWEQTRHIMYCVSRPHFNKRDAKLSITAFYPFPWEKTKSIKPRKTPEEIKAAFKDQEKKQKALKQNSKT